jgi:ABC-type multidrug transport system ATPase subunit
MTDQAVVLAGVTKKFGDTVAVNDVSLTVNRGELFGFIGPDGAGKTTLFRILTTLQVPQSGRATVLGHDVVKDLWTLRPKLGYMPGRFSLYPDLSVEENIRFFAAVFGTSLEAEYEQIAPIYTQLEAFKGRRAGALSGGMKQKLALCCALVHRPEILFLDEPTTGVDSVSRREFWALLARFKATGLTTLVSTPYMDEATRCDRIALMQKGKILAVDTPDAIIAAFDRPLIAVRSADRYRALLALREYPQTFSVFPFGDVLHFTDQRIGLPAAAIGSEVTRFLAGRGLSGVSAEQIPATIEDSFMAYMGSAEEAPAA